jgi:hypothetical protein
MTKGILHLAKPLAGVSGQQCFHFLGIWAACGLKHDSFPAHGGSCLGHSAAQICSSSSFFPQVNKPSSDKSSILSPAPAQSPLLYTIPFLQTLPLGHGLWVVLDPPWNL